MPPIDPLSLSELKDQMNRIERAICGDPAMGQPGIVGRLASVESRVETIEDERSEESAKRSGALWVISSAAAVAGAIGGLIAWLATVANAAPKP